MSNQQTLQRGWTLHQSGDVAAAEKLYRNVLAVSPKDSDALVYLGIALFDQREFEQSVDAYRQAIAIRSDFPIAWNNLGNSLRMLGEVEEAEECFATSLAQQPGYLSALKNRGTLWVWAGEVQRGLQWYEEGLKVDPKNAELHRNLGVIYLLLGDYDRGWNEYRWRWAMPGMYRPQTHAPLWRGEPVAGKKVLLYAEQGRGDAIQFVRSASVLAEQGAEVYLQCAPEMVALFSSAPGVTRLLSKEIAVPQVDFHASMVEVVDVHYQINHEIAFAETLHQGGEGYLTVSQPLIDYWKKWLEANTSGRRIGINWQGNPEHHADVYRSMPLEALRPLSQIEGVQLVNLQFGFGSEQFDQCDFADQIVRLPDHVDATDGAFTDTAAILKNLDGVITTDTAIAHLAGAVGADVTVMLGRVPDWRWLTEGDSTRWYPTMKLVRQAELGCWDDVVEKAASEL